ncbi:hypothetical protein DSCO28_72810 (plasmid) [Desulfosarcina ovata subsp. sediminis]|uniref:Uncharacterized protein n=1 Tax=Desulfosarcina ovata subsp. sediminis TaxID=885957 RepID=A0A5K8A2A1_9BACT|nr:hypothetical protein [Desulfosarcina ovata]BBO86715.1 hypothetical protein DSCO28_72810 [Desulfosarcina ovata subsp. sediminis]
MPFNKVKIVPFSLIVVALIATMFIFTGVARADGHGKLKSWIDRSERDRSSIFDQHDEGNETAGQIAAWLLVAANLTVALSVLIKWTNRFAPVNTGLKNTLSGFNRFQKKHLMRFHYLLNPIVLGIALWHWLSSRCKSTVLPEWGLTVMVVLIALGLIMKLGLCPKPLRKSVYRLHTQPLVLAAMVTVLTIGHLIVD